MKKLNLFLVVVVAAILTSCGTYTYQESTARFVEPSRAGFVTPVVCDMIVSEAKIENVVEIYAELKKREINAIMAADMRGVESSIVLGWKKYALAETLQKYKADDIVAPTFTIAPSQTKQNVIVVTVTGHTAVYKYFRRATQADVELFKPFVEQKQDLNLQGGLLLQRVGR